MPTLPDPQVLAKLVSFVTEQLCEAVFLPEDPLERGESVCAKMYLLPLVGEPRISVVLGCDRRGSRALARAIFKCDDSALKNDIADDAVRELLNMVASQIRTALVPDHNLGLPRLTSLFEIIETGGLKLDDAVLLRSQGKIDLRVWVFEQSVPKEPEAPRGIFRSLLRRNSTPD
jgi:hypothetical protein